MHKKKRLSKKIASFLCYFIHWAIKLLRRIKKFHVLKRTILFKRKVYS
jgi:hypothetical protein